MKNQSELEATKRAFAHWELFDTADTFNLAGEPLDNSITPEGEARVRALAEAEARKAQTTFLPPTVTNPAELKRWAKARLSEFYQDQD